MKRQCHAISFLKILNYLTAINFLKNEDSVHLARRIYINLKSEKGFRIQKEKDYINAFIEVYLYFRNKQIEEGIKEASR